MCNHSQIVVAIVASAIFFLCWKMTRDTINGVVVGCLFYEIVLYCNAGNEVAILVCATLYVAGIVVIAFGVPASLLYLLYLARSRWSVKRSIKLVRAMARRVSPLAGIFFFLSLTGCGNDEETLITLIYIVYVAGWMVIILGSALIGWGMFVLIRKFVRFLRSAKE
jgi:hypothetical protein